jgi:amidohydrolase
MTNKWLLLIGFILMLTSSNFKFSNIKLQSKVESLSEQIEGKVIEWRHYLHEHPELSNREFKTSEYIADHLRNLGLEVQTGIAHTGVVGILTGAKPGPVIALRADMDALPVKEPDKLSWKSNEIGNYQGEDVPLMHACGHDTHMAILLGTAEVLSSVKSELQGTVKFIFQPAEEGPPEGEEGGARMMVKEGVLKNPDAEVIFGLHIRSDLNVGKIGYKPGGAMASSNHFKITITGKQAHGGTPWLSIDPIVTTAQIINNAQTIVSRNLPLVKEGAVLSFGSIHGGVRHNIIPEEVVLTGTIRALDEQMRQTILERLRTIVEKTAESNGATASLEIHEAAVITYNDPELVTKMLPSLESAVGEDNLKLLPAMTPAEDFSYYQQEIPGFFFWLGGAPLSVAEEDAPAHHTPDFYVDDAGMIYGVKAMSRLVIDYMDLK